MAVNSSTIIRDTVFYVKNFLLNNLTDPISSKRPTNEKFIMTSYPTRAVTYPIVTIKDRNSVGTQRLGFQSLAVQHYIDIEVRVWANTVAERDQIADSIYDKLKDNQFVTTTGQQDNGLHDFQLISAVNVDENDGPKCKVQTYRFMFVAT